MQDGQAVRFRGYGEVRGFWSPPPPKSLRWSERFGGTSVGDAECIRRAARIVDEHGRRGDRVLVVVSALWKITDLILKVLNAARSGHEEEMQESLRQLSSRHEKVVSDSFEGDDLKEVAAEVKGCIQRLSEFSSAVLLLGSATAQVIDMALPSGEKMLPKIFAACLNQMGAKSEFVDSASVLTTDDKFGDASPDMESTRRRSREVLMPCLSQRRIPLVMGYTGATQTGQFQRSAVVDRTILRRFWVQRWTPTKCGFGPTWMEC